MKKLISLLLACAILLPCPLLAATVYPNVQNQGTAGAVTIVAAGTNQNITLTPSGTGNVLVSTASASADPLRILTTSTSGASVVNFLQTNSSAAGQVGYGQSASGAPYASSMYLRAAGSSTPIKFIQSATAIATFAATTGNLLLGGLTTDGTGVLQVGYVGGSLVTTNAGGIAYGTDLATYRLATNTFAVDGVGTNNCGIVLRTSASTRGGFLVDNGNNVYIQSGSVTAITLDSSQNAQFAKLITSYNGIATAGNGVVTVQAAGRVTAQTAAVASVSTYTVGAADASFLISANVNVTTATAHSFSMTCTYTDEGNTSRTVTLAFVQLTGGTLVTLITNVTGAGPYESFPLHIRCKAATAITFATTGTFTTVTYNAEGVAVKLL